MSRPDPQTHREARLSGEQIHQLILERICFAHYAPGEQLKEAALAKEFGVSRTPVRDAIARIGHLGLVETRNGVGTVVIALSDTRIRHLYEMRLELASLIGRLSPVAIGDETLAEARAIHAQAQQLGHRPDSRAYVALNQRLQRLICSLIGNQSLQAFWNQAYLQASSVWHRLEQLVGEPVYTALLEETSDLLIALERRDIGAVGYVQRIHIGYGFQLIEQHLLGERQQAASVV